MVHYQVTKNGFVIGITTSEVAAWRTAHEDYFETLRESFAPNQTFLYWKGYRVERVVTKSR